MSYGRLVFTFIAEPDDLHKSECKGLFYRVVQSLMTCTGVSIFCQPLMLLQQ